MTRDNVKKVNEFECNDPKLVGSLLYSKLDTVPICFFTVRLFSFNKSEIIHDGDVPVLGKIGLNYLDYMFMNLFYIKGSTLLKIPPIYSFRSIRDKTIRLDDVSAHLKLLDDYSYFDLFEKNYKDPGKDVFYAIKARIREFFWNFDPFGLSKTGFHDEFVDFVKQKNLAKKLIGGGELTKLKKSICKDGDLNVEMNIDELAIFLKKFFDYCIEWYKDNNFECNFSFEKFMNRKVNGIDLTNRLTEHDILVDCVAKVLDVAKIFLLKKFDDKSYHLHKIEYSEIEKSTIFLGELDQNDKHDECKLERGSTVEICENRKDEDERDEDDCGHISKIFKKK